MPTHADPIQCLNTVWQGSASGGRRGEPSVSRFLGCLLGGALGDALGYPVEFIESISAIEAALGSLPPERLPHSLGSNPGVSDDTQMTLFTAEGLIRGGRPSPDRAGSTEKALLAAYQRWLFTQTGADADRWQDPLRRGWLLGVRELHAQRAPGRTCLGALSQSLELRQGATVQAPPNRSKGCGAVMRSAPIGLVAGTPKAAFVIARDAAVLTHGHPSGYLSAAYFSAVVQGVARDITIVESMREADVLLEREPGGEEVRRAVDAARVLADEGTAPREAIEQLGRGWVGEEALAIALLCALTAEGGTPDAVRASLYRAVVHAGDSDSTGSLTGNLLGAMFGVEALPSKWLDELELRETIADIARDLHATFVLGLEPDALRYPPS